MHRIRLRGPWDFLCLRGSFEAIAEHLKGPVEFTGTLQLPADAAPSANPGESLLVARRFNKPSGLEAARTLQVVVRPAELAGGMFLNGRQVDAISSEGESRASVLGELQPNNRLAILVANPELLSGAEIWLEIDDTI